MIDYTEFCEIMQVGDTGKRAAHFASFALSFTIVSWNKSLQSVPHLLYR